MNLHDNLARVGELDCVAQQVDQNLSQSRGIADQRDCEAGRKTRYQLDTFGASFHRGQFHRLIHDVLKIELDALKIEMARLDLRQIEDIVDERQKAGAGAPEYFHE